MATDRGRGRLPGRRRASDSFGQFRTVVPYFRHRSRLARTLRLRLGRPVKARKGCNSVLDRPVLGRIGSVFTRWLRKG
jgi:hypothetical protein